MATVQEHLTSEINKWEAELAVRRERRSRFDILDDALLSGAQSEVRADLLSRLSNEQCAQIAPGLAEIDAQKPESIKNEPSVLAWYDAHLAAVEATISKLRATLEEATALGYLGLEWPEVAA